MGLWEGAAAMIRIILGNIGSGKTITAVQMMAQTNHKIFTNIRNRLPNTIPLEYGMIVKFEQIGQKKDGTPIMKKDVNWQFWKDAIAQYDKFSVYIDELHNILMARRPNQNIEMIKWIAQIRKLTGSSEETDLVAVSQELSRVDVALRDLCAHVIYCEKFEKPLMVKTECYQKGKLIKKFVPLTYIINYHFTGHNCVQRYWRFRELGEKTYNRRAWYLCNEYMKFYDTYQIVDFGEGAVL
jgi:hypothetical protein